MATKFRYLEDYQVGEEGVTDSRSIGEGEISRFGCATCDYSTVHFDHHVTAPGPHGGIVSHGLFASCLAPGMISIISPHIVGRDVPEAYFCGFETNYRRALKAGDSIKIKWRISEKTDDPAQYGYGLVKTAFQVVNQDEISLFDGTLTTKVRKESAKDTRLQLKPGVLWDFKELVVDPEKVYYLEDFAVGEGQELRVRTMTETDVVNFADLTGDLDPLYIDAEFAKGTVFGERIAPGMLVFALPFGHWTRDAVLMKTKWPEGRETYTGHLADGASFLAPVKFGDTLRCRYRVESTRASKTKPEMGILRIGIQAFNQRNEVVMDGFTMLSRGTRAGAK